MFSFYSKDELESAYRDRNLDKFSLIAYAESEPLADLNEQKLVEISDDLEFLHDMCGMRIRDIYFKYSHKIPDFETIIHGIDLTYREILKEKRTKDNNFSRKESELDQLYLARMSYATIFFITALEESYQSIGSFLTVYAFLRCSTGTELEKISYVVGLKVKKIGKVYYEATGDGDIYATYIYKMMDRLNDIKKYDLVDNLFQEGKVLLSRDHVARDLHFGSIYGQYCRSLVERGRYLESTKLINESLPQCKDSDAKSDLIIPISGALLSREDATLEEAAECLEQLFSPWPDFLETEEYKIYRKSVKSIIELKEKVDRMVAPSKDLDDQLNDHYSKSIGDNMMRRFYDFMYSKY